MEGTGESSRMTMSRASHKKRIERNIKLTSDFDISENFRDDIFVFGWRAKFIRDMKKVIVLSSHFRNSK